MKFLKSSNRVVVLLCAAATLQACAPKQENTYYDPWEEYELGRVYSCDEPWPDMRGNTENVAFTGFGCSHQSNFAVMVADPADLNTPKPMTPPDAIARQRVLEAYREGKSTAVAPDVEGSQQLIK